jgi:phenylpropionate dioxygenase-like ring-hydroxylating dioxygenase large terminal subunit
MDGVHVKSPHRVLLEHELWPALRDYWYPVATAFDVQEGPVKSLLLGVRLVLFRLGGQVVCFRDLCVHRGTPLSLGRVSNDNVVCAYHGWEYNSAGQCVRIPAIGPDRTVPRRARVETFAAKERYGIIWVCLGTPRVEIPAFPEYDSPEYTSYLVGPLTWRCSAARALENFVDQAHFPWVHEGILGDRAHPETSAVEVTREGEELRFSWEDPTSPSYGKNLRVYRLTRPFTIHLTSHYGKESEGSDKRDVLFFSVCPHTARTSTNYMYVARNFTLTNEEAAKMKEEDLTIMRQDQEIVESQRPEELPVDLAAEFHIKGPDIVAVAYRRFMVELGIDVDAAPDVSI